MDFLPEIEDARRKVKQPFGISSEVFDVGTLRPFSELPQAVYGPVGLVGESYKGIGLTGRVDLKGHWDPTYDVYAGGQELEEYLPPEAVAEGEAFEDPIELERTDDMFDGRAVLATPVSGLTIGASAYTGKEVGSLRRTGFGGQAEYLAGPWNSEFVFKLSYHHVDGNRFAGPVPEELADAAASGTLKEKTNLLLVSAQFSL